MVRRLGVGLLALLVVVGAAGCQGQGDIQGIPSSLWNTASPDPLNPPGLPENYRPVPEAAPRAQSYDSTNSIGSWKLLEITNNGLNLVIRYSQGGGCDVSKGVYVAETADAVALVPMYFEPHKLCVSTGELRVPTAVISLSNPLGKRELLHLQTSDNAAD
jgi:hypothetical protein